ncbi:hypothetical protein LINGRAHAP2_LOCUS7372 [Linum grandiflorum]
MEGLRIGWLMGIRRIRV